MGIFIGIALAAQAAAAAAVSSVAAIAVGTAGVGGAAGSAGLLGTGGAFTGAGLVAGGAAGLGAYSSYASGQAAKQQGENQEKMAEYNAQVEQRNADAARMKSKFESKRQAEAANRAKSSLTAGLGKAGGLGSPVAGDLAAEQASELELENLLIGYEGETLAMRHESQASMDIMAGKNAAARGKAGATTGYIGAGTSLLTGFAAVGTGGTGGTGGKWRNDPKNMMRGSSSRNF